MASPAQKAAAITKAWRAQLPNTRGARRRYLVPALHVVKTAVRIFDVPGLRQSGGAVVRLVEALKAPKQSRIKAREQIDRIDQIIASVRAEIGPYDQECEGSRAIYLYQAQEFIDKLERSKNELTKAMDRRYVGRLADQLNMAEALDTSNRQLPEARIEFLEARLKTYMPSAESHHQLQANAVVPIMSTGAPQSTTHVAGLPGQSRRHARPRLVGLNEQHRSIAVSLLVMGAFF